LITKSEAGPVAGQVKTKWRRSSWPVGIHAVGDNVTYLVLGDEANRHNPRSTIVAICDSTGEQ